VQDREEKLLIMRAILDALRALVAVRSMSYAMKNSEDDKYMEEVNSSIESVDQSIERLTEILNAWEKEKADG
jgi:hypothetical protein